MYSESFFSRTELLIGSETSKELRQKTVLLVGLGGVGSYAMEALARFGVENLILVDGDIIETSNLNRQLLALNSTIGQYKTEAALQRIKDINPNCKVIIHTTWLNEENVKKFFDPKPDFVIDAIDQVKAKVALIAACVDQEIELVSVLGTGNRLSSEGMGLEYLSRTHNCPLARGVRQKLRQMKVEKDIRVIYSSQGMIPKSSKAEGKENTTVGSSSFVPALAGLLAAEVAIRYLLEL